MEDDQAVVDLTTALQHTEIEKTVENGDRDGERGAREWNVEEMKLANPCIELVKVSVVE